MKSFLKVATLAVCACFLVALVGCGQAPSNEAPAEEEMQVSDTASVAPKYVLVIGNDSRTGTVEIDKAEYSDGTGRADTIILARIDPVTYEVALITVPRDTATEFSGSTVKLNEVYRQAGPEALMKEVTTLTGAKIDYYMDMSFVQFEKFIDAFGGITADVPINMSLQDIVGGEKITLSAGAQELDGPEALVLSRMRKAYANDLDSCRQIQNRQIVQVGIQKVLDDPTKAATHANTLIANMETNWNKADLADLVVDFAGNAKSVKFVSGTGPYKGGENAAAGGLWLADRDEATWKQVIAAVEAGEDPTKIVPLPTVKAAK